ncbi:hypothetical protein CLAIMM_08713 isoform 1 [Cladophialophora immunda]|nr:hypothetical protein CLAIMM_08713 isoform 1 [Cladophialophora immunda]
MGSTGLLSTFATSTLTPTASPAPSPSIIVPTSTPTPTTLSTVLASTTASSTNASFNPAFVGYENVGMLELTTVYSSANCLDSSTFYSSSYWATCCSGPCNLYTGCLSQSILQGPLSSETCSATSTCQMNFIYPSSNPFDAVLTAYFCDGDGATPVNFYRVQPTDGILSSNTSAINAAKQSQSSNPFGLGLGGSLGGVAFLVIIGLVVWSCLGCPGCGGRSRRRPTGYNGRTHIPPPRRLRTPSPPRVAPDDPDADRQWRNWQELMAARQDENERAREEYNRQQEQARMDDYQRQQDDYQRQQDDYQSRRDDYQRQQDDYNNNYNNNNDNNNYNNNYN